MKYMNMKKKFYPLNLQLFADDNGDDGGPDSGDAGGDDPDGDDDPDEGGDGDEGEHEKKYTEAELEAAVKKRLAREKRKWSKAQKKPDLPDGKKKDDAGDGDEGADELRKKAQRADELEDKWTCLEHDVDKSSVDDVLALARVHMAKDEDLDLEDAIDKVLKKYPQFKDSSKKDQDDDDDDSKGKAWGERQSRRKGGMSGVEAAFLKKNPGIKI